MYVWNRPDGKKIQVVHLQRRRPDEYGVWSAQVLTLPNRHVIWVKEDELEEVKPSWPVRVDKLSNACPNCGAADYIPGVECGCGLKEGFRNWLGETLKTETTLLHGIYYLR